jgi:hypothetical protein
MDKTKLLSESCRVLMRPGHLVVYTNGFSAQMVENPNFQPWSNGVYAVRYPTPPRPKTEFNESDAAAHELIFGGRENFDTRFEFTPDSLTDYVLSHSNVIAKVECGDATAESAREWILKEATPLFQGRATGTFIFHQAIWYLAKA